jgi:hypothetical protein
MLDAYLNQFGGIVKIFGAKLNKHSAIAPVLVQMMVSF